MAGVRVYTIDQVSCVGLLHFYDDGASGYWNCIYLLTILFLYVKILKFKYFAGQISFERPLSLGVRCKLSVSLAGPWQCTAIYRSLLVYS